MKRYQFILNGQTIFKNVSPEKEQAFFEKYGKYNPTLVGDAPGKSKGTSQSQNNQQKNTESRSESGSSEPQPVSLFGKFKEKLNQYRENLSEKAKNIEGDIFEYDKDESLLANISEVNREFSAELGDLLINRIPDNVTGGWLEQKSLEDKLTLVKQGENVDPEVVKRIIEAEKEAAKRPPSEDLIRFTEVMQKQSDYYKQKNPEKYADKPWLADVWAFIAAAKEEPAVAPALLARSMSGQLSTIVNSPTARNEIAKGIGVGAGGALAVNKGRPSLRKIGLGVAAGAMFKLNQQIEIGNTAVELLQEELGDKEFNLENIEEILQDKETFDRIRYRSWKRGNTIGLIEVLGMGLSGKVYNSIKGASKIAKLKRVGATLAVETTAGSLGELGGQIAGEQDINIQEIGFEGFAGAGGAPVSIGTAILGKGPKYSVKDKYGNDVDITREDLINFINTEPATEITKANITIERDSEVLKMYNDKARLGAIDSQLDVRIDDAVERQRAVELEDQRMQLEESIKKERLKSNKDLMQQRLVEIETELNQIIGNYTEVAIEEGVQARMQERQAVKKEVAEKVFKTNLEFAKKHSAIYGLKLDDTLTREQIRERFGNEAADADGFIEGDTIIVNTEVAALTRAVNVGNHELLHGILRKAMRDNPNAFNNIEQKLSEAIGTQFETVQQRAKENYTQEYLLQNPDEWLTLTSDAIANGDITYSESVFQPLIDVFLPIIRAAGFKKINFESGQAMFDFLKEYNRSIHKGSLSSGIVRETGGTTETTGRKMSKSLGQTPLEAINDLIPDDITTKALYDTFISDERRARPVAAALRPGGVINNYIRSRENSREEGDKMIDNVTFRLFNFNPEATRADGSVLGPEGFGEFLFANTRFAKLDARKQLFEESQRRTKSLDDDAAPVQVADTVTEQSFETSKILNEKNKSIDTGGVFIKDQNKYSDQVVKDVRQNIKDSGYRKLVDTKHYEDIKKDFMSHDKIGTGTTRNQVVPTGLLAKAFNAISQDVYGVDSRSIIARGQNLSKSESEFARNKIAKDFEAIGVKKDIESTFPQFQFNSLTGKSVGISKAIQDAFYDAGPGIRVPNLKGKALNLTKISDNEIKALFGINPDNTLMPYKSKMPWDGFVKGYVTQKSAITINQEARQSAGKPLAKVGISKPKMLFSKSMKSLENMLNVKDNFYIEQKGKDGVLKSYGIDPTYKIKSSKDIDVFIEDVLINHIFKLGPKEMWFGPDGGTAFTSSSKNLGLSSKDPLWIEFVDEVKNLGKINSYTNTKGKKIKIVYGDPIPGVDSKDIWTLRNKYNSMFKNPNQIRNNKIENNDFNKKVSAIHSALFYRINSSIRSNKNNARAIATYLGFVANDRAHWHKLGAQFVAFSKKLNPYRDKEGKLKSPRFELEHAMPATNAYLYLLDAALDDNVNFDATYKLIIDNYKLIALDKAQDVKLTNARTESGYSLQKRMPDNWSVVTGNFYERYFNSIVAAIQNGIDPAGIEMLDGTTMAQTYLIKSDGSPINIKASKSKIKVSNDNREAVLNTFKYAKSGVSRGMSTFDFDDTLAQTKSGVRATVPNLDDQPKPSRKVIFLAGGAGSGKGNVVSKLGLSDMGFKIVNSDISLEWLKKNSGLPADMNDLTPAQRSTLGKLGAQARKIARGKMMKYQGNANGVVVDGTGGSVKSMQKLVDEFKSKGYDVSMIFVDTSLDVALARNRARQERSLLDSIVRRNHEAVQANKSEFKNMFGKRFMEVNTDNLTQASPMPDSLVSKVSDFVYSYEKLRLDAEEFATQGDDILNRGGTFDFSEFNKVVDGTPGPFLEKARQRIKKFGNKDVFVLTARPQASAKAIQEFLKSQGIDIPVENITGLADSTGEAKARWMLNKFAEGYNDMYFVDDAMQNVKAVKQVLDQLDIKSDVVQAKRKFSKTASQNFNTILEESQGISRDRTFSEAIARKMGANKGWWRIFVPPSAEDFKGLLYRFLGTGRQGEMHMKYFKLKLLDPFAKGIRAWNIYKQEMVNEYKSLKKNSPNVVNILNQTLGNTGFTVDAAIRVYLWDRAGFEIPGLDTDTKQSLINYVYSEPSVKNFADALSFITKTKEGYVEPTEGWSLGTISTDLNNVVNKVGRRQFLAEYLANAEAIFTPENMNKIEALYGTNFRTALQNILFRMENGGNRVVSPDSNVNFMLNWINGSIGAIMFFNMRSALLQTISTVNFINWSDNNIFKASAAFANQPQFWSDFAMLFNSPQLKQRRAGIQIDVSASELSRAFSDGRGTAQSVINYLLEKGFTPTQIADSFAISLGGASFYRNRFNTYKTQGLSDTQANEKAMLDFQEIAEETQQSSREDLISQQQASPIGRLILAFQNVTMQYTRLTKKALSDLVNGRGDFKTNISKIVYYGAVQNIIFGALQTAIFFFLFQDDDEEKKKVLDNKKERVLNGALDSLLRGTGLYGAIISTVKNTILEYRHQQGLPRWKQEDGDVILEITNLSPPIGSKLRKIFQAIKTEKYNKGVSEELGPRIENPDLYKWSSIIEAVFNIPAQRIVKKANNLEEAITGNHLMWQRIMLALGWNRWDLGVKDEELEQAKQDAKDRRKRDKKRSDAVSKNRCTAIKKSGGRCKNLTKNKNKRCYAHQ